MSTIGHQITPSPITVTTRSSNNPTGNFNQAMQRYQQELSIQQQWVKMADYDISTFNAGTIEQCIQNFLTHRGLENKMVNTPPSIFCG